MSRIEKTFERLRSKNEKALIPYVMAGDPYLERTEELVMEMERAGADIVELGVPFSDPIADGPVIQKAGQRSLKWKTSVKDVLRLVQDIRKHSEIPLVLMTYYNPVFKFGPGKLFKEAAAAGVDGVIIPDLPPEEGAAVDKSSRANGIDWILLAAPTTPEDRLSMLAKRTRGFLYYVSLTGITGAALRDLPEVRTRLAAIRKMTGIPVAAGFGVRTPEQARSLAAAADGVIVGSAIVRLMEERMEDKDLPSRVGAFIRDLKRGIAPSAASRPKAEAK